MKSISFSFFGLFILGLIVSCSKNENKADTETPIVNDGKSKYAIWLQLGSWPNTTQYVAGVDDLTSGEISLEGNGDEVTSKADYGIVARGDGYYYYPSSSTKFGKMVKLEYKDEKMQTVKEVPFTFQEGIGDYFWINDKTLVFVGVNGDYDKVIYTVVDTETLEMTNGEFDLPGLPDGYTGITNGNSEFLNGKIYLTFNYSKEWPEKGDQPNYLAVIDYPNMTTSSISEDTRVLGMGLSDMWESGSAVDESEDIYMLFKPGWIYESTNTSAIYRIKKAASAFDQSYLFNITETLGEATGFWYIGKGRAIVKYKDAAAIAANPETLFDALYALVDLPSLSVVKKLDIPLDKGSTLQSVTIDNGKAYIVVNAETEKDYVWEVDPNSGAVSPGLEIVGGYDYILRIDRMK